MSLAALRIDKPIARKRFDTFEALCHAAVIAAEMEARMSVESHLAELERRHEALKRKIHEAQTHVGSDEVEIAALKRRKLHLKDEIAKLRTDQTLH